MSTHAWTKSPGPLDRWYIDTGGCLSASARVTIGHDSGPDGAFGIWGHNALGPTIWSFDSDCVHTPDRARELGEALMGVLCRRELTPANVWVDDKLWAHFTGIRRTRVGDFDLMVRSEPKVITNGRRTHGGVGGSAANEERVDCWAWWVIVMSEDGARELWRIKSWSSIREVGVAMSFAERVAAAFAAVGFGRAELDA